MSAIEDWLEQQGLGKYKDLFVDNEIDFDVLSQITSEELAELGISLGARKRILNAIRALPDEESTGRTGPARPAPRQAERRQLTVMFCDLVGSTALSRRMDPEDLREVISAFQGACRAAIEPFDGYIARYMGDGLLVYFGYPHSHEDNAERAVRAALSIVAALEPLAPRSVEALAARIGIATGDVVVGDIIGEGASEEHAALGDTPNLAARLQAAAESGQILIEATTQRLVSGAFELDAREAMPIKGFGEPVESWRVVGERASETRFEAAHAGPLSNFVGRVHELGLLTDRWRLAQAGEGQVVLIAGEAGIGKSRLLQSLSEQIAGDDFTPIRYQCSPYHTNSVLYPTIRQLQHAARFAPGDSDEARLDKLEVLLAGAGADRVADAPLFANLLSIPFESRYGELGLSAQQAKELLLEALVTQLVGLAERHPVFFLFEDAHWIDPTTGELLEKAVVRIRDSSVLLIVTHRLEWKAPFAGSNHVTSLQLSRLGRAQGAQIVRGIAGEHVSDEAVERIVGRTDGVPLFIEELTKTLVEGGFDIAESDIPATLQASLLARIDRLGADAKAVAQIGAVIGRDFSYELLSRVAGETDLDAALDRLTRSELVFRSGVPPQATYTFKHALIQDAAYDSLLRARRQTLHALIGEVYERDFSAVVETQPQILAHHYSNAGRAEQAVRHWLRAGIRATEASADAEAHANLSRGLAELSRLPRDVDSRCHELDLLIAIISPTISLKGYSAPETLAVSERAMALCRETGQVSRIYPALYGQWAHSYVSAQVERTRSLARNYLELAQSGLETPPLMVAHRLMGTSAFVAGLPAEALRHLDRAIGYYDPERDASSAFSYGQDVGVSALCYSSLASGLTGRIARSRQLREEAAERAGSIAHAGTLCYTLWHCAFAAYVVRDWDAVEQLVDECRRTAEQYKLPLFHTAATLIAGGLSGRAGRPADGLDTIDGAESKLVELNFALFAPLWALLRAELLADLGRIEDALRSVTKSLDRTAETRERWAEAELHRVQGELLDRLGDGDGAGARFDAALDVARQQGARLWELRTAVSRARWSKRRGDSAGACELLGPLLDGFGEQPDAPDLVDAKLLMDELA